jgi:hypothetical protein
MKITKEEIEELQNNKIQDITDILVAHMMDVKDNKIWCTYTNRRWLDCPYGKYKQEYR